MVLKGEGRPNRQRLPSGSCLRNTEFLQRISACWYSHTEREQNMSDHSLLILEAK